MRRKNWKTAARYAMGITVLAAAIAIAMVLPQWYGSWQDTRMMEKVHLESRENIEFMDTDNLDIAGRMRLFSEAETLRWDEYSVFAEEAVEPWEQMVSDLKRKLEKWVQCGLVPEDCLTWISESGSWGDDSEGDWGALTSYVYADQTAVRVICYELVSGENQLTILADTDLDLIFYVAWTGPVGENGIISALGYENMDEMIDALIENVKQGIEPEESSSDEIAEKFAKICGADSYEELDGSGLAEADIALEFENFTGYAYRRVVSGDIGIGFSLMLGSTQWQDLVLYIEEAYGGVWVREFNLYEALLSDLGMKMDAGTYYGAEEVYEMQIENATESAENEKK